ncbi:MAG: hypothetical protein PVG06_03235 [Desulfobacterales bacterium]|jgi:hypothetical protein
MGLQKTGFVIGFLLLTYLGVLLSCASDKAPLPIENSLPQSELVYYCDTFDSLREDVWEKAGYVFSAAQLGKLKIADMTIEEGRLRIDTKTGGFSKGGLISKFALRGDFDVQIDFQIDFLASEFDMDQLGGFGAMELAETSRKNRLFSIGFTKVAKSKKGGIRAGQLQGGKYLSAYWHPANNFNGSFRFVRIGDRMSTFYRKQGQTRWTKMSSLPSTQKDTIFGIVLQNFVMKRNSIKANRSITAWIDNFTINAAQEIIESEI